MTLLVPRYWVPDGAGAQLIDADGFRPPGLVPHADYVLHEGVRILPTARLSRPGCMVLLGEPGLGKSTALRAGVEASQAAGDATLAVDLGATGQEDLLRRRIFEAPAYRAWQGGAGILRLFLDGLDEARLRVETVADLLIDGLHEADHDRLWLQLTCRTGDRHRQLEERLAALFGDSDFAVYELLPLGIRDVRAFAVAADVAPQPFLNEVRHRHLGALASRPMTLRLLLSAAAEGGRLPASMVDLYRRGCRLLAREPDEDRRDGVAAGRLDVPARTAVASRIAAAVVLSGRVGVQIDELLSPDRDYVSLEALTGGRELRAGAVEDSFPVDEAAVRETLRTALFVARGDGRIVFAHQTIAEFLAASYLATRMRREQVLDLVTLRGDDGVALVPQVSGVSGWLASLAPVGFELLLDHDLAALTRSDLSALTDEQRAALVDALLKADPGAVHNMDLGVSGSQLVHPGLERQLSAALDARAADEHVYAMALRLVEVTESTELAERLVDLVLDESQSMARREAAADALMAPEKLDVPPGLPSWAPEAELRRLLPLARRRDDRADDLRPWVLFLLWPTLIDAETFFSSLGASSAGKRRGRHGWFLGSWVAAYSDDAGLVTGLDWACTQPLAHQEDWPLYRLVESLLIEAWERRDDPDVFAALVRLVRHALAGGHALLSGSTLADAVDWLEPASEDLFRDRGSRRALVAALVPAVAAGELEASKVALSTPRLLDPNDLEWLTTQRDLAVGEELEVGWVRVLDAVRERFGPHASTQPTHVEVELDQPPPDVVALVDADLDRFEGGDLDAFWHLNEHLALDPANPLRPGPWAFRCDLCAFPGWPLLDEETHRRIVDAAYRFLAKKDAEADGWFRADRVWEPAKAGYRALWLLVRYDEARLLELGALPWQRWAPIIMTWTRGQTLERMINNWAVEKCFELAPEAAVACFGQRLKRAQDHSERRNLCYCLPGALSAVAEQALLAGVLDPTWPWDARTCILRRRIEARSQPARAVVERLLTGEVTGGEQRAASLDFAAVLVDVADDAGWPVVWPLIEADAAFGGELMERMRYEGAKSLVARLGVTRVAELIARLGAHDPSVLHQTWCRMAMAAIAISGADEAGAAIDDLVARFPQAEWGSHQEDVRELEHRAQWRPPSPEDVVRIGSDRARRWVTTDAELREVLLEALGRAQVALQGATPAAADLWDTTAHRPKRENEISDWLQRWLIADLRGRGVVIGREVQIRPGPGGKMGESGDLVVEAVASEHVVDADVVTVTVEVKGCWHREVDDAMRHQLVERYLRPAGHTQGIYVVAWFAGDGWDPADYRCGDCRRGLVESRELFSAQAGELSTAYGVEVDAVVLDCSLPGAG